MASKKPAGRAGANPTTPASSAGAGTATATETYVFTPEERAMLGSIQASQRAALRFICTQRNLAGWVLNPKGTGLIPPVKAR